MSQVERARRQRIWQLCALIVVAATVAVVAVAIGSGHSPARLTPGRPVPGAASTAALFAGIPQRGISLGDPRAPVTLVEFADLQCPFCGQFARDALPTLVSRYVRPGRVQVLFRGLAFIGPDSQRAALAAAAAGAQNRLWQFVELFYENQGVENSGYVDDRFLQALTQAIGGLAWTRLRSDRGAPAAHAQLEQAKAQASGYAIASTPSFLVARSGQPPTRYVPDALDAASFSSELDRVLAGGSP